MLLGLITFALLAAYVVLIILYTYLWQKVPTFEPGKPAIDVYVSVIVAARNEAENLPRLLQDLRSQDYPPDMYEVIIVDDYSTDNTESVVRSIFPEARLLTPSKPSGKSSKKVAIATGVDAANGQLLLITDADCSVQKTWISNMVQFYASNHAAFIAAPVKYVGQNSWLNIFQKLDFMMLQGITAAGVHARFHYMCNGANLAYTKNIFREVGGFESIDRVASGDDMLLMQKIAKRSAQEISYLHSEKVIVHTKPPANWKEFLWQRKRWASKTSYYHDYRIIGVLLLVLAFNLLFFVLLIAAFFDPVFWWLLLTYLLTKTAVELIFLYPVSRFFGEEKLLRYFILFQPLHIFYTSFIGIISQFGKYSWKGRQLR